MSIDTLQSLEHNSSIYVSVDCFYMGGYTLGYGCDPYKMRLIEFRCSLKDVKKVKVVHHIFTLQNRFIYMKVNFEVEKMHFMLTEHHY